MNSILYSCGNIFDLYCHPSKDAMIICERENEGVNVYLEYNNILKNSEDLLNKKELLITHKGYISDFAVSNLHIFLIEIRDNTCFINKYNLKGEKINTIMGLNQMHKRTSIKISNDSEYCIINISMSFVLFHIKTQICETFYNKIYIDMDNNYLYFMSRDTRIIYKRELTQGFNGVLTVIHKVDKMFDIQTQIYLDNNYIYYKCKNQIFEIDINNNS